MIRKYGILLLFSTSIAYGVNPDDQALLGGYGYGYDGLLGLSTLGATGYKDLDLAESAAIGLKQGVTRSVANATAHALTNAIGEPIQKAGSFLSNAGRAFMRALHGTQGFEIHELVNLKWILERSITINVTNVAKGARVVRAHVLEQESKKEPAENKVFGVQGLKNDLLYLQKRLTDALAYYGKPTAPSRSFISKALDSIAVCATGASLWHSYNHRGPEYYENLAFKQLETAARYRSRVYDESLAARLLGRADHYGQLCNQELVYQQSPEADLARFGKYATAALDAWRIYAWLKAKNTPTKIDTIRGIDHPTIAHLVVTALDYTKYLITLCDQVHEEGDIARLKDEFEGKSRYCAEAFAQIAAVISPDAVAKLRWTKPGQSAGTGLNQAAAAGYQALMPTY